MAAILLSDLLKKTRKYEVTISLLNLRCIFWQNPWNLALILISNILLD